MGAALRCGFVLLAILLPLAISYLLSLAGEPQSVWLWCDILGAC